MILKLNVEYEETETETELYLGHKMMRSVDAHTEGFTMAELLVVVAIIVVLVAVAIPVFGSQLEKSREVTDMANIRAAYAEVMSEAAMGEGDHQSNPIGLIQKTDGWQSNSGIDPLSGIAGIAGSPAAGGHAQVEYDAANRRAVIRYKGPGPVVPGAQATMDAYVFSEGSDERLVLLTLERAEQQALELYAEAGETQTVGYLVKVNRADGSFTLERKTDAQKWHYRSAKEIINGEGYMIAVNKVDGQIGVSSNLVCDTENKTLTGTPYHIYSNKWHNEHNGIELGRY